MIDKATEDYILHLVHSPHILPMVFAVGIVLCYRNSIIIDIDILRFVSN